MKIKECRLCEILDHHDQLKLKGDKLDYEKDSLCSYHRINMDMRLNSQATSSSMLHRWNLLNAFYSTPEIYRDMVEAAQFLRGKH